LSINKEREGKIKSRLEDKGMLQSMPRLLVVLFVELGSWTMSWSQLLFLCVQVDHYALLSTLQLMYTVGYSLSLISLFLALTLFLFLR
jgi:hypothetical protein